MKENFAMEDTERFDSTRPFRSKGKSLGRALTAICVAVSTAASGAVKALPLNSEDDTYSGVDDDNTQDGRVLYAQNRVSETGETLYETAATVEMLKITHELPYDKKGSLQRNIEDLIRSAPGALYRERYMGQITAIIYPYITRPSGAPDMSDVTRMQLKKGKIIFLDEDEEVVIQIDVSNAFYRAEAPLAVHVREREGEQREEQPRRSGKADRTAASRGSGGRPPWALDVKAGILSEMDPGSFTPKPLKTPSLTDTGDGDYMRTTTFEYKGELRGGVPNGRGEMVVFRSGEWLGAKFIGEFKNSLPHGKCRIEYNDGGVYDGYCVEGERQGRGKIVLSNGNTYEGEWIDDMPNGYGITINTSGYRHEGQYQDGRPHGKGKSISATGLVFDGEFRYGHEGSGSRTHPELERKWARKREERKNLIRDLIMVIGPVVATASAASGGKASAPAQPPASSDDTRHSNYGSNCRDASALFEEKLNNREWACNLIDRPGTSCEKTIRARVIDCDEGDDGLAIFTVEGTYKSEGFMVVSGDNNTFHGTASVNPHGTSSFTRVSTSILKCFKGQTHRCSY